MTRPWYYCPGEFQVVLFAVLIDDGAFNHAHVNAFQTMMSNSDDFVDLGKFLAVIHLILQSKNKLIGQIVSRWSTVDQHLEHGVISVGANHR